MTEAPRPRHLRTPGEAAGRLLITGDLVCDGRPAIDEDRLLERLRQFHGEGRPDIAPELMPRR